MNTARIVVLTIALGAGGVAAYLARGTDDKAQAPAQPIAQLPTVEVLVAKNEIGLGQSVKPDDLQWQTWPAAAARGSIIKRGDRPDASKQIAGMIARAPFIARAGARRLFRSLRSWATPTPASRPCSTG